MASSVSEGISSEFDHEQKVAYTKVFWRCVPLFFCCYVVSYLDRVNIGFAKLQMLGDLQLSDDVYALGASMLFWGYLIFEIPSNVVLNRVGARRWIPRIMISWGIVTILFIFVQPLSAFFHTSLATMFYVLRFLLGACEAGFFPGVLFYLNNWVPSHQQNRVMAGFMLALPVSMCIGGPVSGWVLQYADNIIGYRGWQWMLLVEGLPAIVLGFAVLFRLTESIDKARWLTEKEKLILTQNLIAENITKTRNFRAALHNPTLWILCGILLTMNTGFYGLSFWLPTIVRAAGIQNSFHIGLLSGVPYVAASVVMLLNAAHSNRTGERRMHAAIPALLAGLALSLSAVSASRPSALILLVTIAASGIIGITPIFWALASRQLTGTAAAAGLAMINSVGSISGITGAMITNVARNVTGDVNSGTYVLGACLLLTFSLILLLPRSLSYIESNR